MSKAANPEENEKNENSSKSRQKCVAPSNHSTPIRQKPSSNNAVKPFNPNYPSPVLLLCTQDGGSEVAWDWQNRTPTSRNNKQDGQPETPKGTKISQRKRNSDSPLLCKPIKRKSFELENIENIGQFAAELQALNEKMRTIKKSDQNDMDDCIREAPIAVANTSKDEEVKLSVPINQNKIPINQKNCAAETDSHNSVAKRSSSDNYLFDLFDDWLDDSMVKCTQEFEEKFNLIAVKGRSADHPADPVLHPQIDTKIKVDKEKSSLTNNTVAKMSSIQPKESIPVASSQSLFHGVANSNNTLRTYSKSKDESSSVFASTWKDKDKNLHKLCLNNNIVHYNAEKSCDVKKSSKASTTELFDSDDSFDDCIASCVDETLLSTSIKCSGILAPKLDSSYKNLSHAPLKGKLSYNNAIPETRPTAKVEASTADSLNNRKFFKSKSLSEQYIAHNNKLVANCRSTTAHVTFPSYAGKSASHLNSTKSRSTVTSVSTDSTTTSDSRKIKNNAMSSANSTMGANVSRFAVKETGNRLVKYNSSGNIENNTKELTKSDSLPARCTAEEIERKRLQAMMRLEAKRKLYALNRQNNVKR